MRHRLALSLLVASLLIAGACADDDGGDPAGATTTTSTTADDTAATCEADDADAAELEALLTDTVPDGFEQQADEVGDTGPSDLAKAARDDGLDDAAAALTELGFRRGYQRLWADADDDQLVVFVYEFCDEDGAAGYVERTADQLGSTSGFEPLDTSIEGATGVVQEDAEGTLVAITAPTGSYDVQVVAFAPAATADVAEQTARAEALLAAQIAELDAA